MTKLLSSFRFRDAGTPIGLILISAVFASMSPTFLTTPNLMNVLQQSSINACIALGMTLVIISGGIDLSVGPVAALTAVLGAAMMVAGVPIPLALLGALAVGVTYGFGNGAFIAWGGLQPFIVTLGGLSLYRALALIYTGGTPIFGLPDGFRALTNGTVGGDPNPVVIVPCLALVAWVTLNKTPLGEYFMAVGGNPEAARIAAYGVHDFGFHGRRGRDDPDRPTGCRRTHHGHALGTGRHCRLRHRRGQPDGRARLDPRHADRLHYSGHAPQRVEPS